jgi:8-oxo-dGTP pyrophosphatase MutT (NUDIX family)
MSERRGIPIESPGVNVAVIRKDRDGWRFLLLKRAYTESYAGSWGFVTGTKSGDESAAQIAARELAEETGLTAKAFWATEYVIQFYEPEFDKVWILPLIAAIVPSDSQVELSAENDEFVWLSAEQARERVSWKNLIRAIDDLSDELKHYPAPTWVALEA